MREVRTVKRELTSTPKKESESNVPWGAILAGLTPAAVGILTGAREAGYAGSSQVYSKLAERGFKDVDEMRKIKKTKVDNWREKEDLKFKHQKELAGYKAGLKPEKDQQEDRYKQFNMATKLRADYLKLDPVKKLASMASSYNVLQNLANQESSGPNDMAFVYNFQKMNDPSSVVRESEFRSAAAARAWLDKVDAGIFGQITVPTPVRMAIDSAETGVMLTDKQRNQFVDSARTMYASQQEAVEGSKKQYTETAKRWDIDPRDVIVNFNIKEKKALERKAIKEPNLDPADKEALVWARDNRKHEDYAAVMANIGEKYGITK